MGQFTTLKIRDWILFEVEGQSNRPYPLKIRYSPVKSYEFVYAIGWGAIGGINYLRMMFEK